VAEALRGSTPGADLQTTLCPLVVDHPRRGSLEWGCRILIMDAQGENDSKDTEHDRGGESMDG
jgi:hypothetical protein